MLLDTCANAEEAQQLLLTTKQFYMCAPCHYLIRDRYGHSFVWEYSPAHNMEHIIVGNGQAQILSNHLLTRYRTIEDMPFENFAASSYTRYRTLFQVVDQPNACFSPKQIKANNQAVFINARSFSQPQPIPDRTIWNSVYDCNDLSLEVSFYLQDDPMNGASIYSSYQRFGLKPASI